MNPQEELAFPTYPHWLASHSDDTIAALLKRLIASGSPAILGGLTDSLPEDSRRILHKRTADPAMPAALSHLSALELAILHAAVEADAAHTPVSVSTLGETLDELLDLAGTTPDRRPSTADLTATIGTLAHWGLVFGPDVRLGSGDSTATEAAPETLLKTPPQLPDFFAPTTDQPWRLADVTSCPLPEEELARTIDELPPRQRRLLVTLLNAGGIGNSASLHPDADPSAPLPTMVRAGILDQLDDHTARLSGRVQQFLRGTLIAPPGGVFLPPEHPSTNPNPSTAPKTNSHDEAAAATALQLIEELSDTLRDLAHHPITPLSAGGIGVRELTKITRRRSMDTAAVLDQLTWLAHANLAALNTSWAATDLAADFLGASPARAWALLLLGWAFSPYRPWAADEEQRPFSPELFSERTARLRTLLPGILHATGSGSAADTAAELWRLRPDAAWHTPSADLTALLSEAARVGLLAPTSRRGSAGDLQPTGAARALAETLFVLNTKASPNPLSDLTVRLERVLPDPVDTLIIQADHTIMAPGLLASEDADMLRRIAERESAGVASMWRISQPSLLRGLATGLTPEEITNFLRARALGGASGVPQSLDYLIRDTHRVLTEGRAAGEEHEDGVGDGLAGGVTVETPHRPWMGQTEDSLAVEGAIGAAIETFRRAAADADDVDEAEGWIVTNLKEMIDALKRAYTAGTVVDIAYADRHGERVRDAVSVVMMSPSTIALVSVASGASYTLQPYRLSSVASH